MRRISFCLAALLVCALLIPVGQASGQAQESIYSVQYRPPGISYRVLASPHFDVVFQEGLEDEAREAIALMEASLPRLRELIGHRRGFRAPLLLHGYSDRGNGFMALTPFRMEIEAAPNRSKSLSARHSSWMALVAPHELAHAVHADFNPGGLAWLFRPLSPDGSRSVNMLAPGGIIEGLAVFHESELEPGAGRLNNAFTRMQFDAALAQSSWSLAQLLEDSDFTRPFDRQYVAGSHLFASLAREDDGEFFRRAARLHYWLPFMGYGLTLWHGTGIPTWDLGNHVVSNERARIESSEALRRPFSAYELVGGEPGLEYRRPRYLPDGSLLVYARGYDIRPGFYLVNPEDGSRSVLSNVSIAEDLHHVPTGDASRSVYARYVRDRFMPDRWISHAFEVDLVSGRERRIRTEGRIHAPARLTDGTLLAARIEGQYSNLVRVEDDGSLTGLTDFRGLNVVAIEPHPLEAQAALVLNLRGRQGLFRMNVQAAGPVLEPVVFLQDASVYDLTWSPAGDRIFFSADPGMVLNIFSLEVATGVVRQVTNARFGALEPTVSSDGRWLSYVDYEHEAFRLVRIPLQENMGVDVTDAIRMPAQSVDVGRFLAERPVEPFLDGEARPYRAAEYLLPRAIVPTIRYRDDISQPIDPALGLGVGLSLEGADPLLTWRYAVNGFYQARRLWGEATVQTGRNALRPYLTAYNRPFGTKVIVVNSQTGEVVGSTDLGVEERGVGMGVNLPVSLGFNVFQSSMSVGLRGEFRQTRFMDVDDPVLREFRDRLTLRPSGSLVLGAQRNPRDLTPNLGLITTVSSIVDVWTRGTVNPSRALIARSYAYLPILRRSNTTVRFDAGVLTQNRGALYDLFYFMPRGTESTALGEGTFARYGLEVTQPLFFVDDGVALLPMYLSALYAYGFGESLSTLSGTGPTATTSFGAGIGALLRVFYVGQMDLRLGFAFNPEQTRIRFVGR
jgi:hypothetical protein